MWARIGLALVLGTFLAGCTYGASGTPGTNEISLEWPLAPEQTQGLSTIEIQTEVTTLELALADNAAERAQGLSGLKEVPEDGMLFIFEEPGQPEFWMKDMLFNIDIVWLSEGQVVGVEENVPAQPGVADKDLRRYAAPQTIDAAIEVPAGHATTYGLRPGVSVSAVSASVDSE